MRDKKAKIPAVSREKWWNVTSLFRNQQSEANGENTKVDSYPIVECLLHSRHSVAFTVMARIIFKITAF